MTAPASPRSRPSNGGSAPYPGGGDPFPGGGEDPGPAPYPGGGEAPGGPSSGPGGGSAPGGPTSGPGGGSAPGGGPGQFGVHVGVIRQHSNDVIAVQTEFKSGIDAVKHETLVTELTFGEYWAVLLLPPFIAVATSFSGLSDKIGSGLHDLGIRIDATADVYDKGEAHSKALVARAAPKTDSFGSVLTNDGPQSTPDSDLFGHGFQAGSTLAKLATGGGIDPADTAQLVGDLAFDGLAFAADPLGTVVGSFVGLIIDMIPPIKELIDLTLGDPDSINKASSAWDGIARYFVDCGNDYQESLKTVTNDIWSGDAADSYRTSANAVIQSLGHLGGQCESVSGALLMAASIIGDTRSYIVGETISFIIEQAVAMAVADAAAVPTFGASLAAFFEEFAVDAEMKLALIVMKLEQAAMHLGVAVEKAYAQQQKFDQYAAELQS